MKEYLDIVDAAGLPTGQIVDREMAHAQGIWHRTAHLWLVRKQAGRLQVLLQKRAACKDSFPGCYDISSAGHIPAGVEFVQSAIRELQEELGITAQERALIRCGDRKAVWDGAFRGREFHDREYARVFLLWTDLPEDAFTVAPEEVELVHWMDLEECMRGVQNGTFSNCIALEELQMVAQTAQKP